MRVGVPKEIKPQEYRVGLTPMAVREYVAAGHSVFVQSGAGLGIGADDEAYAGAGAQIVPTADEVFSIADMIVKVKEPQPAEWKMLREGQILFTYLHLAPDPDQAADLLKSGAICIAYETVTAPTGGLPLLAPMSEVAGRLSVQAGARCLEKSAGGMGMLLGGVSFNVDSLMPKFSRIDPLAGLARMFSMNALVELAKAVLKLVAVSVPVFFILTALTDDLLALDMQSIQSAMAGAVGIVGWGFLAMAAATMLIAMVDVPWQLYSYAQKLKMSFQEIQEEMKDTDGRPEVKSRIRRLQQEMSRKRMLADVPQADVIITNPDHYAVALKYDADKMGAPRVLAKGVDFLASRIRQAATEKTLRLCKHLHLRGPCTSARRSARKYPRACIWQLPAYLPMCCSSIAIGSALVRCRSGPMICQFPTTCAMTDGGLHAPAIRSQRL